MKIYWLSFCLACLMMVDIAALQVTPLTFTGTLQPGESKQVTFTLYNDTAATEEVLISPTDYMNNYEGEHFYEKAGTQARSNATWIKLHTRREILTPGQTTNVFYTIEVPKDYTLTGSYWSMFLVEPVQPYQTIKDPNGLTLEIKMRYAYSIITNVGVGASKLKVLSKEFRTLQDSKIFAVDVLNTGTLFLKPKLTLKLYDDQGKLEKTMESSSELLYPGSSQRFSINYAGWEGKRNTAFLLLDAGENNVFADTFQLTFPN